MENMNEKQIISLLLSKENEITNKFHQTVEEILRLGWDSERGKTYVPDLIESVQYSLEEILRIINR